MKEMGQDRKSAQELTEAIERETSQAAELAGGVEVSRESLGEGLYYNEKRGGVYTDAGEKPEYVERTKAGELGGRVLAYDAEAARNEEYVLGTVARENGEKAELSGEESSLLVAERKAWDEENQRNEDNPHRDYEAQIAAKDQRGIAEKMMNDVERMLRERVGHPRALEQERGIGVMAMLGAYENPRRIGGRN